MHYFQVNKRKIKTFEIELLMNRDKLLEQHELLLEHKERFQYEIYIHIFKEIKYIFYFNLLYKLHLSKNDLFLPQLTSLEGVLWVL